MGLVNDKQTCSVSFGKRCNDVVFLALQKQVGESALRSCGTGDQLKTKHVSALPLPAIMGR